MWVMAGHTDATGNVLIPNGRNRDSRTNGGTQSVMFARVPDGLKRNRWFGFPKVLDTKSALHPAVTWKLLKKSNVACPCPLLRKTVACPPGCVSIRMVALTVGPATLTQHGGGFGPPPALTAGASRRSSTASTLTMAAIRIITLVPPAGPANRSARWCGGYESGRRARRLYAVSMPPSSARRPAFRKARMPRAHCLRAFALQAGPHFSPICTDWLEPSLIFTSRRHTPRDSTPVFRLKTYWPDFGSNRN